MKIQVNSDCTFAVDARLTQFVEGEVNRLLDRFANRLTRVEVHLTDVDNMKSGNADKRCLIEARPAGAQPRTASAKSTKVSSAVDEALRKMQRSLITFFGRKERPAATVSRAALAAKEPVAKRSLAKKAMVKKALVKRAAVVTKESAKVKKAEAESPTKLRKRGPRKKRIYQARRKPWPAR